MLGLINKCRIILSRLFTPPPCHPSETHTHSSASPHLPLCGSLELFRSYEDDRYHWRNCGVIISFTSHAAQTQTWSPVVRYVCMCGCGCVCLCMCMYVCGQAWWKKKNVPTSIGISGSFDLLGTFAWSQQGNFLILLFFFPSQKVSFLHLHFGS